MRATVRIVACRRGSFSGLRHLFKTKPVGDILRQFIVDVQEMGDHPLSDFEILDLAQLECKGVGYVGLLNWGLADIELARLTIVIGK